jgi:hypothetical protein
MEKFRAGLVLGLIVSVAILAWSDFVVPRLGGGSAG